MTFAAPPPAVPCEAPRSGPDAASEWTFVVAWSDDEGGTLEPLTLAVRRAQGIEDALVAAAEHLAEEYNADNASSVAAHQVFPRLDSGYSAIAHVLYLHPGPPAAPASLPLRLDSICVELDAGRRDRAASQATGMGGAQ